MKGSEESARRRCAKKREDGERERYRDAREEGSERRDGCEERS